MTSPTDEELVAAVRRIADSYYLTLSDDEAALLEKAADRLDGRGGGEDVDNKERVLLSLNERKAVCWAMAKVFLLNEDAHGIHDMGVEIQALDRAIKEIENL